MTEFNEMTGTGMQVGGRLDHVTGRRFDPADHMFDRRQGAEPVRHVRELGSGDARKEVLGAAGEACDFVRNGGPDDEDEIVAAVDNARVQAHGDGLVQQAQVSVATCADDSVPIVCSVSERSQ